MNSNPNNTVPAAESVCAGLGLVRGARAGDADVDRLAEKLGIDRISARRVIWLYGARPEPAAAIILIGGKSARMGTDKSRMLVDGTAAAERLYSKLKPHFDDVFFAGAAMQSSPVPSVPCVHDAVDGRGPLAGIAAGLSASSCRINFIIACDIPEIDIRLIRTLLSFMEEYEIAVPAFSPARTEPLLGAYNRSVGATAGRLINEGFLRVISLYDHHSTRIVPYDGTGWYVNLNTPEDMRCYLSSTRQMKKDRSP